MTLRVKNQGQTFWRQICKKRQQLRCWTRRLHFGWPWEFKGQGHKRGGNGDRHVWIYASRVNWLTCSFLRHQTASVMSRTHSLFAGDPTGVFRPMLYVRRVDGHEYALFTLIYHREPKKKHTKMFLSCLPQNPVDSDLNNVATLLCETSRSCFVSEQILELRTQKQ